LRTAFAPDAKYREIALKKTLEGVEEIIGFMRHLAKTFPDVRWDVVDVVAESPDKLAIQWMSRRTIEGVMNEAEGVSFMHRRDGRIWLNADFRHRGA
jgi:ketosteroid isomerase-like protein